MSERRPGDPAAVPDARRTHRMRRHAASGNALRFLDGFRQAQTRIVIKALEQAGRPEYRVSAIGLLDGVSLLTECPLVRGVPALRAGERLEIRLFAGRDLVVFESEMMSASTYPAPYVHLAWPHELCVVQVRSSARVQLDKPATFGLKVDQELIPVSGHIVDLSIHGAAFLCDALGAVVGDEGDLLLVLDIDDRMAPVYVHPRAVIRSVREPLHKGGCLQYGLEFFDVSTHDALAIRAFLGLLESSR